VAAGGFSGPGSSGGALLPTSRRCLSRRRFEIRVKRPRGGARLRPARVRVGGKRVEVRRRHGRLRAIIDLRGRPKRRVRVRIVAVTRSGRRLHDTRVYVTEPAKWVARLRETVTNDAEERPVLLRTEIAAGHGGRSGRYAAWEQLAWEWAFVLDQLGAGERLDRVSG